jgi:hypothetical protein
VDNFFVTGVNGIFFWKIIFIRMNGINCEIYFIIVQEMSEI